MPTLAFNHFSLRAERQLLEKLRAFYVDVIGLKIGDPYRSTTVPGRAMAQTLVADSVGNGVELNFEPGAA